jgi:geranylgeranyl pyrophosphate synthase
MKELMSSAHKQNSEFDFQLNNKREIVNNIIHRLLIDQPIDHGLKDVLHYTLRSPGKRIRSVLVLLACELVSGKINHNAEIASAAIEMVHTYSLVHDDLPAMDNDDFRRGRPSCHKAFDEATAILAGDALLTLAFEILAKRIDEPVLAVRLISELAEAAEYLGQ